MPPKLFEAGWNDQQVFLHVVGTPGTVEITESNGGSIPNVKGMVVSSDRTTPTGSSVWMWNGQKVLLHVVGTPSTVEITNPDGGSIPNVRGLVVSFDATTPTGSSVWIWNDQKTGWPGFHGPVGFLQRSAVLRYPCQFYARSPV